MENITLNYDEFIAFMLIHGSYADLDFSDDERKKILAQVSIDTFNKVNGIYHELNDSQILKLILDHKGIHYPTEPRKYEILGRLQEQFDVDGNYSILEKGLLQFLTKLM